MSKIVAEAAGHYNTCGFEKTATLLGREAFTVEDWKMLLTVATKIAERWVDDNLAACLTGAKDAYTVFDVKRDLAAHLAEQVMGDSRMDLFLATLVAFQVCMGYPPGYTYAELYIFIGSEEAAKYDWSGLDMDAGRSLPNLSIFGIPKAERTIWAAVQQHINTLAREFLDEDAAEQLAPAMTKPSGTALTGAGALFKRTLTATIKTKVQEKPVVKPKAKSSGAGHPHKTPGSWNFGRALGIKAGAGGP